MFERLSRRSGNQVSDGFYNACFLFVIGVATPKLLTCLEEEEDFGLGHSVHSAAVSGAFTRIAISETCYLILVSFVNSLMFVVIFNYCFFLLVRIVECNPWYLWALHLTAFLPSPSQNFPLCSSFVLLYTCVV